MVGKDQKVVAVLAIPIDDELRRAIAVAPERVRVGVSAVPVEGCGRGLVPICGSGPTCAGEEDCEKNAKGIRVSGDTLCQSPPRCELTEDG